MHIKIYRLTFLFNFIHINLVKEKAQKNEIFLTEMKSEDFSLFLSINENPKIQKAHLATVKFKDEKTIKQYFKYYLKQKEPIFYHYTIFYKNKSVGFINFIFDEINSNNIYIAYSIKESEWNKGIVTIAIEKLIEKYKNILKKKYKQITATVKINNIGSIKVLEKNGFKKKINKNGEPIIIIINGFAAYKLEYNL